MESNNEYNVPNGEGSRIIQNNSTNYNERDNNLIITGNVLVNDHCDATTIWKLLQQKYPE
uniref:Uncharacterized protein n=1 Tax=Rhizophagus irregularis (strain DAOM 181602 / DAOM 197198 / MUCL 43194) TaxID=747089 RepID=U9T0L6_RHIID